MIFWSPKRRNLKGSVQSHPNFFVSAWRHAIKTNATCFFHISIFLWSKIISVQMQRWIDSGPSTKPLMPGPLRLGTVNPRKEKLWEKICFQFISHHRKAQWVSQASWTTCQEDTVSTVIGDEQRNLLNVLNTVLFLQKIRRKSDIWGPRLVDRSYVVTKRLSQAQLFRA